MENNLKTAMSKNREQAVKVIYDESNNFNNRIFYNQALKAWIICDNKLARSVLRDKNFIANRKGDFINKLNITTEEKETLRWFYSKWLMYMDGKNHKDLRNILYESIKEMNESIKEISKKESKKIFFYSNLNLEEIECVENVSEKFTTSFLSQIFGISIHDYKEILKLSGKSVSFLWLSNPSNEDVKNTIWSIKETKEYVNSVITNKAYKPDSLFGALLSKIDEVEDFILVLINVLIDGHEPFVASLSNLIFHYSMACENTKLNMPVKKFVNESIKISPAFSYCARKCSCDTYIDNEKICKGDRVMIILYTNNDGGASQDFCRHVSSNKKSSSNLPFGFGDHYCVGAQIVTTALSDFLKEMKEFSEKERWTIVNFSHETTHGFEALSKLVIKFTP